MEIVTSEKNLTNKTANIKSLDLNLCYIFFLMRISPHIQLSKSTAQLAIFLPANVHLVA